MCQTKYKQYGYLYNEVYNVVNLLIQTKLASKQQVLIRAVIMYESN